MKGLEQEKKSGWEFLETYYEVNQKVFLVLFLIVAECTLALFTSQSSPYLALFLTLTVLFFTLVYMFTERVKLEHNLLRIYGLFNNRFSDALGFVQLLLILIHIGLITDVLHEIYKAAFSHEYAVSMAVQLITYCTFFIWLLFLPFNINSVKGEAKNRKVLISPLSLIRDKSVFPPFNLEPFNLALAYYQKQQAPLKNILLLTNTAVLKAYDELMANFNIENNTTYIDLGQFLRREFFKTDDINLEFLSIRADTNSFEAYFKEAQFEINNYLITNSIEEKHTSFFMIPGNKISSIALAIMAVPSERGALYIRQRTDRMPSTINDVEEFDLSVMDMKQLWNELLNKLGEQQTD